MLAGNEPVTQLAIDQPERRRAWRRYGCLQPIWDRRLVVRRLSVFCTASTATAMLAERQPTQSRCVLARGVNRVMMLAGASERGRDVFLAQLAVDQSARCLPRHYGTGGCHADNQGCSAQRAHRPARGYPDVALRDEHERWLSDTTARRSPYRRCEARASREGLLGKIQNTTVGGLIVEDTRQRTA